MHPPYVNAERFVPDDPTMIARLWHGAVNAAQADEYYQYLLRTGVPDYRGTAGNLGVHVLRRVEQDHAHFLVITFWESYDAIRAFAADDLTRARYYPEDEVYLVELEPFVTHYEVLSPPR